MSWEKYHRDVILKEFKDRKNPKFRLGDFLFKEQLDFVADPSPFKTAVCSRRAGKTIACAGDLSGTAAFNRGVTCLYITLSRNNAKKIVWEELKKINRSFGLGGVPNESELSISYPGGSIIYCSGANDKTQIEKFRGLPLKKVYIDECQSFPNYIRDLVDDVISPALMDYAGTLCLIGTPGPIPSGFFYDCSLSSVWTHHTWTFQQNPHILSKSNLSYSQILERELTRRGVDVDDPSIQREYFARWVLDSDALVYHYDKSKNDYLEVPIGKLVYIMGLDFGYEDADAISILAWSESSPVTYLVEELVVNKQGLTELINQVETFRKKYEITKIVADFGGLGKKMGEEMARRYQMPIQPADKARKHESIELMNDALRTSRFKAKSSSRFASDSMLLEWDLDKSTPDRKVVSDRFHSDILDATLYAFRESPAYAWTPEPVKPKWGTPEWAKEEVTSMEEAAEKHFKEQEDMSDQWEW